MNIPSDSQKLLSKITEFYRMNLLDSDARIKFALQELLHRWSEIIAAANHASDDELFALNISRAFLSKIFTIATLKKCFMNDHSFTREILRTCLNLLVDHIDRFSNKTFTIFLISNLRLIMEILASIIPFIWCRDIDLFTENDYQLLFVMREYVHQDMTHDNLTDEILSFIWNISDNTLLVPLLLKTNYAKSIIQWIEVRRRKFREDKQNALIYILLNMVRHDDAIEQFNSLNALNVIDQAQLDSSMVLQVAMIRVLLTDRNHMKFESIELLTTLVQLTINAARDEEYRYEGSHVCEPLTVVTKLFFNEEILHNILDKIELKPLLTTQSMIELFASLLIKFYANLTSENYPLENFTCILLFNVFRLISNHQEYCQIIFDNEQLMTIIQNAANNEKYFIDIFMPRTMKSIDQSAIEILRNLKKN